MSATVPPRFHGTATTVPGQVKGKVEMTINIAVVTGDALVLGCDSIASSSQRLLDPFRPGASTKVDQNGRVTTQFDFSDLGDYVTDVWVGVPKMFCLCRDAANVAATTAGLAKLNGRTMADYADEFCQRLASGKPRHLVNVGPIAREWLRFMRRQYNKHHKDNQLPPPLWDDVLFLVGGFGRDDKFPSLYRISLKDNRVDKQYVAGEAGLAWAGQSEAVYRLMFGYALSVRVEVEQAIEDFLDRAKTVRAETRQRTMEALSKALKVAPPASLSVTMPPLKRPQLSWDQHALPLSVNNMPTQHAIDFAAFLVNLETGRSKFYPGIETVGGRTHIGLLTRTRKFKMLNEPELEHSNLGFARNV